MTKSRKAVFGAACRGCPLRPDAPPRRNGRPSRSTRTRSCGVRPAPRHDPDFQHVYRARPMVERTIAGLVRGNRRVPYRGVAKNNTWLHNRIAGLNLRRMLALGLSLNAEQWQIA